MKKFIKELFSLENLKKAGIYSLLSQSNLPTSEYVRFANLLRDMETNNTTIEVQTKIKKAA
jgi:hypothetical protein